jgi:hypothetical protein
MSATIGQIREAISRTGEARERVRQHRGTDAVIAALAQAAKNWLDPNSPWRKRAIEQGPAATGFSEAMVSEAVDLTFGAITGESLGELLDRELGNRRVLDGVGDSSPAGRARFTARVHHERKGAPTMKEETPPMRCGQRTLHHPEGALTREGVPTKKEGMRATGPRLIAHFLAGNVPVPGIVSLCCGLLLRSANLVKVSSRDPVFPALFVESLREVDAELADCVAVLDWRRDEAALTRAALADADAVMAYGDDETISALRALVPAGIKFLGYGHKVSLAVVAKEAMTEENLPRLAQAAAFDASVYDQQGCMSPHVFYVEEGGRLGPRKFAAALAEAMAAYQARVPQGKLSVEEAAQVAKLRGAYEFRSASDKSVGIWVSEAANSWLVIYEDEPMFTSSCLNRVVFVKPTDGYKRVLDSIQKISSHISTVGVASMDESPRRARSRHEEHEVGFATELARLGVSRVCPIGQMQRPPLSCQHDGQPNLADLVSWTEAA